MLLPPPLLLPLPLTMLAAAASALLLLLPFLSTNTINFHASLQRISFGPNHFCWLMILKTWRLP
jgi:hypothetical protein